ncbi:MAG: type II secretion system protein M [Pseudohongiella sp.]|nr:type II secretion system protein M [Pseudohongiella sp.]
MLATATKSLRQRLITQWLSRSPRERRLLTYASATLTLSGYIWMLVAGTQAGATLRSNLPGLRMQAITLDQHANEIAQLRPLPSQASSNTSLLILVQSMAEIAGLSDSLSTLEALDINRVAIEVGTISFPLWIDWINTLEQQGIRVERIRMETLLTPGFVSASVTLLRVSQS